MAWGSEPTFLAWDASPRGHSTVRDLIYPTVDGSSQGNERRSVDSTPSKGYRREENDRGGEGSKQNAPRDAQQLTHHEGAFT